MRGRVLAVLVAVVLATVGSIAVLAYVHGADARALAGREPVQVLVAAKRIPAGTSGALVRSGGFTQQLTVPASTVPTDSLGTLDPELDALVLTADVQPRQLLLRGAFGQAARLTADLAIPPGKFAVSIPLQVAANVAGHVQPGVQVAVFDTFTVLEGKGLTPAGDGLSAEHLANQATRLLLPRVTVISVGQGAGTAGSAESPSGKPSGNSSGALGGAIANATGSDAMLITVAVTQDEAQRLVHGTRTGLLYLALLSEGAEATPGQGVDNTTLFP